jgi:hypothetical protein
MNLPYDVDVVRILALRAARELLARDVQIVAE